MMPVTFLKISIEDFIEHISAFREPVGFLESEDVSVPLAQL